MSDKHNITPKEALQEWLARLKIPRQALDGHSICPFSKRAGLPTLQDLHLDDTFKPLPLSEIKHIKIYNITNLNITSEEMDNWCDFYMNKYNDYIFLADHKDRDTFINGVKTNNGYYNFMLVQSKAELNDARKQLLKTNYYSHWDPEYLKDTWNNSFKKD